MKHGTASDTTTNITRTDSTDKSRYDSAFVFYHDSVFLSQKNDTVTKEYFISGVGVENGLSSCPKFMPSGSSASIAAAMAMRQPSRCSVRSVTYRTGKYTPANSARMSTATRKPLAKVLSAPAQKKN